MQITKATILATLSVVALAGGGAWAMLGAHAAPASVAATPRVTHVAHILPSTATPAAAVVVVAPIETDTDTPIVVPIHHHRHHHHGATLGALYARIAKENATIKTLQREKYRQHILLIRAGIES